MDSMWRRKFREKKFIFNDGYCPIHRQIRKEDVLRAKEEHPDAVFLVHPECAKEVVDLAEYAGSTSGIIKYASASEQKEFLIGTEAGVFCELKKQNPDKAFYPINIHQDCPGMKLVTLEKIYDVLLHETNEVQLDKMTMERAKQPLTRMLELAK